MATIQPTKRAIAEKNTLALVFLVTFAALAVLALWLIYMQVAQLAMKNGQCTVLSSHTAQDVVDTDNPTTGAKLYTISFTVALVTADGQRLQVPGYHTSTNYNASDAASIDQLKQTYAVGKTLACSYTYLDPSGIKAIFQPAIPSEGFWLPGFFLIVSLVLCGLCIRTLRRPPAPEVPFPAEMTELAPEEVKA